jgi:predicted dehydrogenase
MSSLVVGYGSIGKRHAKLLADLDTNVSVLTSQELSDIKSYRNLGEALANESPDYVVIANETSYHYKTLIQLKDISYKGIVLVEKPLFDAEYALSDLPFQQVFVGYNLRFNPIIQYIKNLLMSEPALSLQVYVGQYLPNWRPQTDYRNSYSASIELGGGVLRDLSHELDYLLWMLGGWSRVVALGGKYSDLEITSDDIYSLMIETPSCPIVNVQLNYLDKIGQRSIIINTNGKTIKADLVNATLTINDTVQNFAVQRDDTYRAMHQAVLQKDFSSLCSLNEGLNVMRLIMAAEQSVNQKKWVLN